MRPKKCEREKKINCAARQARYRASLIHIGNSEMARWKFIKEETALTSDRDVAKLLIDSMTKEYLRDTKQVGSCDNVPLFLIICSPADYQKEGYVIAANSFIRNALANAESDQGPNEMADKKLPSHRLPKAGTSSNYKDAVEGSEVESNRHSQQPMEPEGMEMDCDVGIEEDLPYRQTEYSPAMGDRVVRSRPVVEQENLSKQVEFMSIHGLPVNVPFTLQYTSPIMGDTLQSKVYVIVEQEILSYKPITSVTITAQGEIFENALDQGSSVFMTDIYAQKLSSWVNIKNIIVKQNEKFHRTEETFDIPEDQYDPDLPIKQEIDEDNYELNTESETVKGTMVTDILHNSMSNTVKVVDVQVSCLPETTIDKDNCKRKNEDNLQNVFEKKQKIEKYENTSSKSERHSSRLQGRGYRINYEKFDQLDDLSDFCELDDELSDRESESDWSEKPQPKPRKRGRPKKVKEVKDTDFNFQENLLGKEQKSDLLSKNKNGKKLDDIPKKLEPPKKRIIVTLSEHTDKYTVEEHVSFEMKDRSKEGFEKTIQMFACSQCNRFRTESEAQMEKHLEHHLNGELSCKKCNFVTSNWREMHTHRQVEHMKETRTKDLCPICGLKCGGQLLYKHHLSSVHNLSPLLCRVCLTSGNQIAYDSRESYRAHFLANHIDHMFRCDDCGFYYMSKISLKKHCCAVKPNESIKVPCDICGKEMRKDSISLHKINVHYNMRRHPCPHCSYAAKQASELKEHILARHEGVHPYKCDQCEFTCVRSSQLVSHQRTHSGHKPYKCDECPYAASWNVQLKDHKKLHGNAIAVECELCGIVVRRGPGYTKHMKKEHGETTASEVDSINNSA